VDKYQKDFFPDGKSADIDCIKSFIENALERFFYFSKDYQLLN